MLQKRKPLNIYTELGILTTARTTINTGMRMVYPLLPVFSRELQVELSSFALVLTLVQFTGLSAPLLGILPERFGRRFSLLFGMMLFNLGMLLVFILPNFLGFSLALLLGALGKIIFDPTLQAHFGEKIPYEKRGMALGIIELAWSGAFFLGVPLMTWLIGSFNWQAPFAALAFLGTIGFAVAAYIVQGSPKDAVKSISFLDGLRQAFSEKAALAGVFLIMCISAANQLIGMVFATWIEDSFGIMLSSLALASIMIGFAELGGEGFVVFFADRLGKRRLIIAGIGANMLVGLVLPALAISLGIAVAGLFFFYLSFELGLVASLPLLSEISPKSRATYMTVVAGASTFGRAISTIIAPNLYEYGITANVAAAFMLNGLALFLLWRYIRLK